MLNALSFLRIVFRRLGHNLGLSASSLIGIIAILTVAVCIPVYSHAVSSEVLRQQLVVKRGTTHRPLFCLRLSYYERGKGSALDLEKVRTISEYVQSQFATQVGLPVDKVTMDIRTAGLVATDLTGKYPEARNAPLSRWTFLVREDMPQLVTMTEGVVPPAQTSSSSVIPVMVPEQMADEMALKLGDHFYVDPFEVEVVGFWRIKNTSDPIWYTNPNTDYSLTMWVPEATYTSVIRPMMEQPLVEAYWYVIIDNLDVHFQRASQYLNGLTRLDADLQRLVAGIKTDYSPVDALMAYETRSDALATLFTVVGSPMIILALIFIGLTAKIAVQQVEGETATMRARGASPWQIALLNLIESALLLLAAVPISLVTGWYAAVIMGSTLSFLQFVERPFLTFSLDGIDLRMVALACVVILLARFFPALASSRITLLRVRQEQARASAKPFWEKFYLDFLLLIPGGYAYFVLKGWSKPAAFLSQMQLPTDQQFKDPLLFVAPAIFAMAMCLVIVRLIPFLVRLLAFIADRLPGVWAYLSLQQIARRSGDHSSSLLLIMISLSLAIFTVSTARTLDQWLYDSEHYKTGGDLAVQEFIAVGEGASGSGVSASSPLMESFLTLEEHLALPGVKGATRVGKYDGKFSFGRGDVSCLVMGIDRVDFPQTAFFRDDFASESLGALMNGLGSNLDAVIFPAAQMKKSNLVAGDRVALTISVGGVQYDREVVVVGSYDYFPTVFPKDKPTLIVNLESIFNYPDDVEGYSVWLDLKDGADITALLDQTAVEMGSREAVVRTTGNAVEAVTLGQDKPERMGLFGILNVGFITTGLMPGIGFLLYSYASLRKRFIQLGILQALGISVSEMIRSLVFEQFILMGLAILGGALTGLVTSTMFVPFLQIGATPGAPVPPFEVIIGWQESAWLSLAFGAVLFLTMAGTIYYLTRLKVFQAVKLGETL